MKPWLALLMTTALASPGSVAEPSEPVPWIDQRYASLAESTERREGGAGAPELAP